MQREYPVSRIMAELERHKLLPGILFRTSRKQCDEDVQKLSRNKHYRIPVPYQLKLRETVKDITLKYDIEPEIVFKHPHYNALVRTGAGAHHAGQLLIWRFVILIYSDVDIHDVGSLRL